MNKLKEATPLLLPEPAEEAYKKLLNYLTSTCELTNDVVERLIKDGLIYQDRDDNIVFVNPERTFAEITKTYKPYHSDTYESHCRVIFSDPRDFWWFKADGMQSNPTIAYICWTPIDAISLYCLHMGNEDWEHNALYCSISGVADQRRINRIKAGMDATGRQVILAVNKDAAGEQCRRRNPDCKSVISLNRDWNKTWAVYCM